ncbi:ABC transporter permease [Taibaiella soli]|uniref:ABC transporter permease n=1 Tax=Taibaiella soli TaxID=1649169 RepID=A0A2W2AR40_9BACT|nr:ABC transporter permease [Taibaiella soli]PZF74910.1 hypothetical protein DN068_01560 [Taibaiella soli]
MQFINSLRGEWLKTRRSAASWLCLIGGFLLPLLYFIGALKDHNTLNSLPVNSEIWKVYFFQIWRFMAVVMLPMGLILSSSLMTQLEFRNNTWKQVLTTPQSIGTIYLAKLSAILLMTLKFFIFFNIGMLAAAIIPSLIFDHQLPRDSFPYSFYLVNNLKILLTCMPVIAIQYLISLRFKNFLVPIGAGLMFWLVSVILVNTWKYAYVSPYSYTPMIGLNTKLPAGINILILSGVYSAVFFAAGFFVFRAKREVS